ncbi:transcription elongation factor GreB [Gynuella sunshinyii]|uniref:Transcription elongation factor GreB n=1 Tax=Gynuella sunshinyii YC6258 TaxID=1445510 RepID=A0A0C5VP90_9GAMM|nr:transcription elongation factor GreB [Gynuella sunshinyii]AJQ96472.1 transcription elongation factor [Gynuella sunshinyii YC6258]
MSRYRPPSKPGSKYITPEGHERFKDEIRQLWQERAIVTEEVRAAAALGDRSENAEYIYGKKRLREIDGRLRHLGKRLDNINVVHGLPKEQNKVFFGAWVKLMDEDDNELIVRIVGPDEFDTDKQYISMDSPLAQALLKRSLHDEVTVVRPAGTIEYWIESISYCGADEL